jgi:hypothetical protein
MIEHQEGQVAPEEPNVVQLHHKVTGQRDVPSRYTFGQFVHNCTPLGIPNNFGDIMSTRETTLQLPEEFLGLERICLTANGNLQRILRFSPFIFTVQMSIQLHCTNCLIRILQQRMV